MRRAHRIIAAVILGTLLILVEVLAFGQDLDGRREQVTKEPSYRGTTANAPVPPELHTRNVNPGHPGWGGCVPSSTRTAALYQRVPREKVDAFWSLARREVGVGGTDRNLLASMLKRTMPDEPWVDYMGPDSATTLDHLSSKGYALCSTMSWGDPQMYPGRIHHWVNPIHFDSRADLACFVDNNDPGRYHWTTAREFAARARDNGTAWIFAFTRMPARVKVAIVASAVLLLDATLLVLGGLGFCRFALKI